jgi:hypothetical protein
MAELCGIEPLYFWQIKVILPAFSRDCSKKSKKKNRVAPAAARVIWNFRTEKVHLEISKEKLLRTTGASEKNCCDFT